MPCFPFALRHMCGPRSRYLDRKLPVIKTDFEAAVRRKLGEVPVATRQAWTGTDLYAWWISTEKQHACLRWTNTYGDSWQYVHPMCMDLIGINVN
jgi:hypothetical protein